MKSRASTLQEQSNVEKRNPATILVVDDEPAVRMVICEVLQRQGYRVLACATGGEALEVYRTCTDKIDLVLLDLTLPDIRGDQLIVDLRRIRPDVRVVSSSGYPAGPVTGHLNTGTTSYLQKPFDAQTLGEAVSLALTRSPGVEGLL